MFGKFQQSQLRIEVEATAKNIEKSLLYPEQMMRWLKYQRFSSGLPEKFYQGFNFTSYTGIIPIDHEVEIVNNNCLRLILSKGIDGYHQWYWGNNWVQSSIEGISILPISLGQTLTLLSLREFLATS